MRSHQISNFSALSLDIRETTDKPTTKIGDPPLNMPPKPELTSDQRKQVVSQLLLLLEHGVQPPKLRHGALSTQVANNFAVKARATRKIWARARQNYGDPAIGAFRASPLKKHCGRKQKCNRDEVRAAILQVAMHRRRTLQKSSSAIGIGRGTLHQMKEDKDNAVIVPHSNAIRPLLEEHHQFARVLHAVANLDAAAGRCHSYFDAVHVDEMWFFITETELNLHLVPGEVAPERSVPHKSHTMKVMFLAALARPRFNDAGACTFDGKIGMWPFVERVAARTRASINRPRGTIETKSVSVTAERHREFMTEKVLPAMKLKWPDRNREIVIQQDGASSHINQEDPAFAEAAMAGNWQIRLLTQPAQSPDTNTLDLSFFGSLQSAQWNHGFAVDMDGLIAQVIKACVEFCPRKIEFGFLMLQSCHGEILISNGNNAHEIPRMGKETLLQDGTLPVRVAATAQALVVARQVLDDNDDEWSLANILSKLGLCAQKHTIVTVHRQRMWVQTS
jgi:hypothetical protein